MKWIVWNAGYGWGKYHLLIGEAPVRAKCGREIPTRARLSEEPEPPMVQRCIKCQVLEAHADLARRIG